MWYTSCATMATSSKQISSNKSFRLFYMPLDPDSFIGELPPLFYRKFQHELSNRVMLKDNHGNEIEVEHHRGLRGGYLTFGYERIMQVYGLQYGGWMKALYAGDNVFYIRIRDVDFNKVAYPTTPAKYLLDPVFDNFIAPDPMDVDMKQPSIYATIKLEPLSPEVPATHSEIIPELKLPPYDGPFPIPYPVPKAAFYDAHPSVEHVPENVAQLPSDNVENPRLLPVVNGPNNPHVENEVVNEPLHAVQVFTYEKVMTPYQAKGGVMTLPSEFVAQAYPVRIRRINLRDNEGVSYPVVMRWSPRRSREVCLSSGWIKYAKAKKLKGGSVFRFRVAADNVSVMMADVVAV